MTDVVLVSIVGVLGTVTAAAFGIIGNSLLESKKAKNERQAYVASTRFSREFNMYQKLCEKHLTMVYDVGTAPMLTRGTALPEGVKSKKDFVHISAMHIDEADIENKRCAPFISKEIFEDYKALGKKAYAAISMFDLWCIIDNNNYPTAIYNGKSFTKEQAQIELEKRQREVSQYSDLILEKLRKYLEAREKR